MIRRACAVLLLACAGQLATPAPATALDPQTPLAGYARAAWTERDGLFSSFVICLAQDRTGYLWVGTNSGLVRFDGVRFARWEELVTPQPEIPSIGIGSLAASSDGGLWIGMRASGGVYRLLNGRLTRYRVEDGLPEGGVTHLLDDAEGSIWAATRVGMSRFRNGRWTRGSALGVPDVAVLDVYKDGHGIVWIATAEGLFRKPSNAEAFERYATPFQVLHLIEDHQGRLLAATADQALEFIDPRHRRVLVALPSAPSQNMLLDRHGNLWIGTLGGGMLRIPRDSAPGAPPERIGAEHGLTSDNITSVSEDREGSIWIGTRAGLNRLSENAIVAANRPDGTKLDTVVHAIATTQSSVWLGASDGLYRISGPNQRRYVERDGLPGLSVHALHEDGSGHLWIATTGGLARFNGSHFESVPLPRDDRLRAIYAMTTDRDGGLWLSSIRGGVFRWKAGILTSFESDPATGFKVGLSALTDRQGRVWFGFGDGTVAVWENGRFRSYSQKDGLGRDRSVALYEDAAGRMWVASNGALSRLEGSRFVTITRLDGFPADSLTSIVGDEAGNLWLGNGLGIVRLASSEFDRKVADPGYRVRFTQYGTVDGVPATPVWAGYPAGMRAADGTLWFVVNEGAAVVDPSRLVRASQPLPVVIERVTVDGVPIDPGTPLELPSAPARLHFDYTALGFSAPSRIHFRHRLDGFDADWVDAGTRRQAFYTNLPPGDYRFRVEATSDGSWRDSGAVTELSIAPLFYQRWWFFGLCLLTLVAAISGAWRLRDLRLRRAFALVLKERARLGREIHDTLLQSLLGVAIEIDNIGAELEPSHGARARLARLRRTVEFYSREARQSIWDLRSDTTEHQGLVTALRETASRLVDKEQVEVEVVVTGEQGPLDSRTEQQLARIGREAVTNALRHSQAERIDMTLHYAPDTVQLRVHDNGRGFDASNTAGSPWGLIGMRERAEMLGGQLRISSRLGEGTEIEVNVPRHSPMAAEG